MYFYLLQFHEYLPYGKRSCLTRDCFSSVLSYRYPTVAISLSTVLRYHLYCRTLLYLCDLLPFMCCVWLLGRLRFLLVSLKTYIYMWSRTVANALDDGPITGVLRGYIFNLLLYNIRPRAVKCLFNTHLMGIGITTYVWTLRQNARLLVMKDYGLFTRWWIFLVLFILVGVNFLMNDLWAGASNAKLSLILFWDRKTALTHWGLDKMAAVL